MSSPKRFKSSGEKIDYSKYDKKRTYNKDQEASDEFKLWITKSNRTEEEKAFCTLCQSDIQCNISKLRDHAKTQKHLKSVKDKGAQKSAKMIFQSNLHSELQIRKRREIRLALITAKNSSLQSVDDYSAYIKSEFGGDTIMLARTKCTAIIKQVLAPWFKNELMVRILITYPSHDKVTYNYEVAS